MEYFVEFFFANRIPNWTTFRNINVTFNTSPSSTDNTFAYLKVANTCSSGKHVFKDWQNNKTLMHLYLG